MSSFSAFVGAAGSLDAVERALAATGEHANAALSDVDLRLTADLQLALGGDQLAFARVYRAVQPGLLRYLGAIAGADAEDVAAEAWSQVCRDLPRFRGDIDGFRGWVARIARNRAIDAARAARRRPSTAVPVEDLPEGPLEPSAETGAIDVLSTEAAIAAIAALPRDQAEAVLLRTVVGLDAVTAARVLGKRPGAVRTAAHRGLRTLAQRVGAAGAAGESGAVGARIDVAPPGGGRTRNTSAARAAGTSR